MFSGGIERDQRYEIAQPGTGYSRVAETKLEISSFLLWTNTCHVLNNLRAATRFNFL